MLCRLDEMLWHCLNNLAIKSIYICMRLKNLLNLFLWSWYQIFYSRDVHLKSSRYFKSCIRHFYHWLCLCLKNIWVSTCRINWLTFWLLCNLLMECDRNNVYYWIWWCFPKVIRWKNTWNVNGYLGYYSLVTYDCYYIFSSLFWWLIEKCIQNFIEAWLYE